MNAVDMSRTRRIQNLNEHSLPALLFITSSRLHRLLLALLKNVVDLSSTQFILIFMDGIGSKNYALLTPGAKRPKELYEDEILPWRNYLELKLAQNWKLS